MNRDIDTTARQRPGFHPWYSLWISLWLFVSLAFLESKVMLPFLGGSEGSTTTGANPYLAEAGLLIFGAVVLLHGSLRRRVPKVLWWVAGLTTVFFLLQLMRGTASGHSLRNGLSDMRYALGPWYFVVLAALPPGSRRWAAAAATAGFAVFFSVEAGLFAAEPTGMLNLNIVPVPVPFFNHALDQAWLYAAAGMFLAVACRGWLRYAGVLLAGSFLVLTFSRSLWVGVPLAALAAAGVFLFKNSGVSARLMAGLLVMAVGGSVLAWAFSTPDGRFLLHFRGHSLCQTFRICDPLPAKFEPRQRVSPVLRRVATNGRLFTPLGNKTDASVSDRRAMLNLALAAWKESPLLGQGLGYLYRYEVLAGLKVMNNPHNGYLWVLSKTGLAGAALLLLALGFAAGALRRLPATPRAAWSVFSVSLVLVLELLQCGLGSHSVMLPLAIIAIFGPETEKSAWS